MKKTQLYAVVILLLLMNAIVASAQNETDTTFARQMNQVFANLEKNRVPYGILRDYAMELTNLDNFNGLTTLADSNYVDIDNFWDVYNTLIMGTINNTSSGFLKPDSISFHNNSF